MAMRSRWKEFKVFFNILRGCLVWRSLKIKEVLEYSLFSKDSKISNHGDGWRMPTSVAVVSQVGHNTIVVLFSMHRHK